MRCESGAQCRNTWLNRRLLDFWPQGRLGSTVYLPSEDAYDQLGPDNHENQFT